MRVLVDVTVDSRMELHHPLVRLKEQMLDPAHLVPIWHAAIVRRADVLPAEADTDKHLEPSAVLPCKKEGTPSISKVAREIAFGHARLLYLVGIFFSHSRQSPALFHRTRSFPRLFTSLTILSSSIPRDWALSPNGSSRQHPTDGPFDAHHATVGDFSRFLYCTSILATWSSGAAPQKAQWRVTRPTMRTPVT